MKHFIFLVPFVLCSCHALVIADHLVYSGSVAKKPSQVVVTDSVVETSTGDSYIGK